MIFLRLVIHILFLPEFQLVHPHMKTSDVCPPVSYLSLVLRTQWCQQGLQCWEPILPTVWSSSFSLARRLCAKYIIQVSSKAPDMAYHNLSLLMKLSQRPGEDITETWARQWRTEGSLASSAFDIIENTDDLERKKLRYACSMVDDPEIIKYLDKREEKNLWACCIGRGVQCREVLGWLEFCVEWLKSHASWYRIPGQSFPSPYCPVVNSVLDWKTR